MNEAFLRYYRCPSFLVKFVRSKHSFINERPGYFKFGKDVICYGEASVPVSANVDDPLVDCIEQAHVDAGICYLPFDPNNVTMNLQRELYLPKKSPGCLKAFIAQIYYILRPLLPVAIRRHLQKKWLKGWEQKSFPNWPVDRSVDKIFENLMYLSLKASSEGVIPFIWFWPEGNKSCAVMTHDVETAEGLKFSTTLMDINDSFEIRSSFQLIPDARYVVSQQTIAMFRSRGHEVNIHDLKHDGRLFDSLADFQTAAEKINRFALEFGSVGFRTGALYRNQEWLKFLKISYDMSVPNVAHLDPQPGGCCTVMPYFVGDILEIPVTTTQDYSLFNIIGTHSIDIWLQQISSILEQHGLMNFIVHPDYLTSNEAEKAYLALVSTLVELRDTGLLWITLPGDVNTWWRQRNKMYLVRGKNGWNIEGEGSERAKIAYARLRDDRVDFSFI